MWTKYYFSPPNSAIFAYIYKWTCNSEEMCFSVNKHISVQLLLRHILNCHMIGESWWKWEINCEQFVNPLKFLINEIENWSDTGEYSTLTWNVTFKNWNMQIIQDIMELAHCNLSGGNYIVKNLGKAVPGSTRCWGLGLPSSQWESGKSAFGVHLDSITRYV